MRSAFTLGFGWPSAFFLALISAVSGAAHADLGEVRSIDGMGNNPIDLSRGSTDTPLMRMGPAQYMGDGSGETMMGSPVRPNPREISNTISRQITMQGNHADLSDMVWLWGQFLDHDIDLTDNHADNGSAPIPINSPTDPLGPASIPFNRSNHQMLNGTRQQINEITAFIDASQVYGSDPDRAAMLRTGSDGLLKTSPGQLLPMNTEGAPNAGGTGSDMFLAGDIRANEHVGLSAMHTLFVREHNRLAGLLKNAAPMANDEQVYEMARKIVGAQMQSITYEEFLPAILGAVAPTTDGGQYDATVDPSIANEFSTALFRFGHSMLSPNISMTGSNSMALRDAFFNPGFLELNPENIDRILKGFTEHEAQEIDTQINDDVRNFLFGPPGAGGMDLAALNIQRGRDHGLPDYNSTRVLYGLPPVTDFEDITSNLLLANTLEGLFGDVNNIDLWVGALAEDHLPGASVGPLVAAGIIDQFTRLRDGDRFFHQWDPDLLDPVIEEVIDLDEWGLREVILANTNAQGLSADIFHISAVPEPSSVLVWVFLLTFAAVSATGRLSTPRCFHYRVK